MKQPKPEAPAVSGFFLVDHALINGQNECQAIRIILGGAGILPAISEQARRLPHQSADMPLIFSDHRDRTGIMAIIVEGKILTDCETYTSRVRRGLEARPRLA